MAKFWLWSEAKAKIKRDLDLEAEVFVRPDELLEYMNEAIDEAEAEIHALYEDYFLAKEKVSLVQGIEEYDLPADIYAHKIRRVIYNNGSSVYTINRIKDWKKFETKSISDNFSTSDLYQFFIYNPAPSTPKLILIPKARETVTDVLTIWYIRNANRLVDDNSIIDIPEFVNFLFQKVTCLVYEKEGHPNLDRAELKLAEERQRMLGVLAQMVPDAENEIELDTSHYEEMN